MSIYNLSLLLVLIFLIIVLESTRRGILETKYSILWILTCIIMGILGLNAKLLEKLANYIGVYYAPSLLFLFAFLFSLILIFDLSRRISRSNHKMVHLAQECALLRQKLEQLEKSEKLL